MKLIFSFLIVTIFYFIIIGIQTKLYQNKEAKINKKFQKVNEEISFNLKNAEEIEDMISKELAKRIQLLDTMEYSEWIDYNQKNINLPFKDKIFYIQIWKKVPNYNDFILKCYEYPQYINNDRADFIKRIDSHKVFKHKFKVDENLLDNFYNLDEKPYTKIVHFWVPAEFEPQLRRVSLGIKYIDKKNPENTGIIISGYYITNISQKYYTNYFKFTKKLIYIISLITFIVSLVLCFIYRESKYSYAKSIILLLIINIYLTIFILSGEEERTVESEANKETIINSGILGISFLVGVNIFIISKLGKDEKGKRDKSSVLEGVFIFVLVLICLLMSTIKMFNYNLTRELTATRLQKELFFNISICLNIYIIINFGLYMFGII